MNIDELDVNLKIGRIGEVLDESQKKRGLLIHALQQIQKEHNYLPEDALRALSRKLGVPLAEVYSTASFYKHFYFRPRGKNVLCVCTGTACHVRGAAKILEAVKEKFEISEGETTADMSLTLETVGCVGCCGLAPVVTLNDEVAGEMSPGKLDGIIETLGVENGNGNGKQKANTQT
ncbi:MAG: NAD(P)H-dependent oxidoreductase subunit E [Nitrospiraceae bacterium]|nr:NAD(P)H-dependent oxidoreductase subunit E [Nitrospiraceae bacterium]